MDGQSTAMVLTEFFGYARDLSVIGFIILVSWKARGIWDGITGFIDKVSCFMVKMDEHADILVHNHLKHLQDSANMIERKLDDQTELLTEIKNDGK